MPNQMTVRQALKSYGINVPAPKPKVDPREVERQMRIKRDQDNKEAFYQRAWTRFMRGE